MSKRKDDHLKLVFWILFGLLLVYGSIYLGSVFVPRWAERDFGRADPQLEPIQRLIYAARLELNKDDLLKAVDNQGQPAIFQIPYGQSAGQIAASLQDQGLIHSAEDFINLLVYSGIDQKIQAGVYRLSPAMNSVAIANHIIDSNPEDVAFSFLAGWRAEEIAALLPLSGLSVNEAEFLSAVQHPSDESLGYESLEGYLYPGEYKFLRSASALDMTRAFVGNFTGQLPEDYKDKLAAKGLTLKEAVILASLVQKEMVVDGEGPKIAGVFLNRLTAGMPLQSDPTVQYALGYDAASGSWWKNPLSQADLQVDSPFNTYVHAGLPPAPICNPGSTALMAVLNASDSPYLYFRAACDGSGQHVFSRTYEEHLAAACE
ncbi:MAG: hypothetical protein PWQ55_1837 [Chloroflexota bacterium]|nr:hypothetical protein [Chloroflexota bacterium]